MARFKPTVARTAIAVDEKTLQAFAGEYELEPGVTVVITLSGGKLHVKAPGQAEAVYEAWSPTEFFRLGGREITFYKDAAGAVTHFVLRSEGLEHEAKKIK